jgi:2-keto-4-pentenoate hydratase
MKIDQFLAYADRLKALSVKDVIFGENDDIHSIEFFSPQIEAEARAAEAVGRAINESPADIMKKIIEIETNDEIPDAMKRQMVDQMRRTLVYGSST